MNGSVKVLFVNDTRPERHFGCEMVVKNISEAIFDAGFLNIDYVEQKDLLFGDFSRFLKGVDLLVINGEGTLHGDRSIGYRIMSFAEEGREAGIPVILLNATLESNSSKFYKGFSCLSEVILRESRSMEEISCLNIPKCVVADAVFFTSVSHLLNLVSSRNVLSGGVYVDDSVIPKVSVDLARLRAKLKAKAATLFYAENKLDWVVAFLKRMPRSLVKTPLLAFRFMALFPRQVRAAHRSFDEFCSCMLGADLIITGRFHMVCLALLLERPFLAVESNTMKISSLLNDVGVKDRVFCSVEMLEKYYFSKKDHGYSLDDLALITQFKRKAVAGRLELVRILQRYRKR